MYDTLTALGDVGGLAELFFILFSVIVGFFSQKFYQASMLKTLFHYATTATSELTDEHNDLSSDKNEKALAQIKQLSLSYLFSFLSALSCCLQTRYRDKRKAVLLGN